MKADIKRQINENSMFIPIRLDFPSERTDVDEFVNRIGKDVGIKVGKLFFEQKKFVVIIDGYQKGIINSNIVEELIKKIGNKQGDKIIITCRDNCIEN